MGHPVLNKKYGIDFSTGSLGMGLSIGVGLSIALKKKKSNNKVYVLLGDGECNEGSVWEAIMSASHFNLENLTLIVDRNNLQQTGRNNEIMSLGDLKNKLSSFGCETYSVNGHDIEDLYNFHISNSNDITLVASAKEYSIPYGTCQINSKGKLSKIVEKPKYAFLVNTGLYIRNPKILKLIPKNKFYHITNLINDAKKLKMNIGVYPIDDDSWIDVGQWKDYKNAIDDLG